jgi:hypothetical protein
MVTITAFQILTGFMVTVTGPDGLVGTWFFDSADEPIEEYIRQTLPPTP